MTHAQRTPSFGCGSTAALASAWQALCGLLATHPWFWLARSGSIEAAPAIGLVLLDALPNLLDALGAAAGGHG